MNTIDFSPEELAAFREEMFQGFSESQFNLAIAECKRRNLVPGQHVYFQLRNATEWNEAVGGRVSIKKLTKVTTIDAFRLISQRTGEYAGQGKAKFYYLDDKNTPSIVSEIPLPHPTVPNTPREPWACSVPIYRKGFVEPVEVVCRFDAYAVTRKSGNSVVLTDMWVRRGPEQLSKCSEAASRRVAFAEELGSMYLSEEFAREDAENRPEPAAAPTTEAPKAPAVPKVDHTPAKGTDAPRPNADKVVSSVAAPEKFGPTESDGPAKRIEDIILDRPATPAIVQIMDKPKKLTKKEQVSAALEAEHNDMMAAIDEKIAEGRATDDRKPTPEESKAIAVHVRSFYDVIDQKSLQAFVLKEANCKEPVEITFSQWNAVFAKLDAAKLEGREAVAKLVKPSVKPTEAF